MVIGVVSDTHGYFHPALARAFEEVDLILHAGDLGGLEILDGLEALAPVRAVYGNVDDQRTRRELPEQQRFEEEGLQFWMTHIAGRPNRWQRGMGQALKRDTPDVFICGHSHILQIERLESHDGMLFLNPGAAGRQGLHQKKTCVRLHVNDGALKEAEVIHLDEYDDEEEEAGTANVGD